MSDYESWPQCIVYIRRNSDGVIIVDRSHRYDDTEDGIDYNWKDGNSSCDCNRALYFATAQGLPDPDHPCGDTAYSVKIEMLDGKVVYDEFDE